MKIRDLKNGTRRANVEGKIIEKSDTREIKSRYRDATYRVANAILVDETGRINLTLWNEQIDRVNVGDKVKVENGYVTSFRGELMLNVGKYGEMDARSVSDGRLYTI